MTDWQLLTEYRTAEGEQSAEVFTLIVARHVNLVYSVARRRMGDEHLARDATQEVFLTLSQKAKTLREGVLLTGWLFETTRFVCLGMKRAERRRQRREKEAAMREVQAGGDEALWAAIAGEVDEAVGALGKRDRDLLLLRYFEGKSHGEIAAALAISEDAAKKRAERAVEALRRVLTGRGKIMSGIVLAGVLGTHAVEAAPGGVAGAVVNAVKMGAMPAGLAGGGGILSVVAVKIAAAIALVAMVVVLPAGVFAWRAAHVVHASAPETTAAVGEVETAKTAATEPDQSGLPGDVVGVDGKPAAGVEVVAEGTKDDETVITTRARTDSGGKFLLYGAVNDRVFAYVAGVAISKSIQVTGREAMHLQLAPAVDVAVTLEAPDGTLAENVGVGARMIEFRDDAQPLGSIVEIPSDMLSAFGGKTDASGKCVIHGLPRDARLRFDTDDQRFAHISYHSNVALDGQGPLIIAKPIRLMKAAKIVGRMVSPDTQKPVPCMKIYAQATDGDPEGGWGSGATNDNGEFVIDRMPKGSYVVTLMNEKPHEWVAAAVDVKIAEGETAAVNIPLTRGGILKGQVLNTVTGQGIAGIAIGLYGPSRPQYAAAIEIRKTDANGQFEFHVPAGEQKPYLASEAPEGYLSSVGRGTQRVTIKEGETTEIMFELQPDPAPVVQGTVVGPDGKPVSGATVSCEKSGDNPMSAASVTTDEQGRFQIHGKNGTLLVARWKDMATMSATRISGATPMELRVEPNATFTVIVELRDDAGNVIKDGTANLIRWMGSSGLGGQPRKVDAAGRVHFEGLPADGKYSLSAEGPEYEVKEGKVHAPFDNEEREVIVKMILRKADSEIAGVVVDAGGKPMQGIRVVMNGSRTGVKETQTDVQGHFSFAVVKGASALVSIPMDKNMSSEIYHAQAGDRELKLVYPRDGTKEVPPTKTDTVP